MTNLHEPSRRERKKEETRRRIFDAAVSLFRERGFEATTVDEITERADVGRGTFFNYFPRKEAVFSFIAEEQTREIDELLPGLAASDEPTFAILLRVLHKVAAGYMQDPEVSRMVLGEWIKRSTQPDADTEHRSRRFLAAMIERGRARGEVRPDAEPLRVAAVFRGIFLATLFQWLYSSPACPEPLDDLPGELEARLRLAMEGIAPRPEVQP
jgi:TetR/AcrR family transcriptional regulator, cholesterol catabolism regulator